MIQSELADKFNPKYGKMDKYKFLTNYCSTYKINFSVSNKVFFPKPKVSSKVVTFKLIKQKIDYEKIEFFFRFFFVNKRKKIKSNKFFSNKINSKYINYRYEDLHYNEILEIYKSFNFS
jgi:16S rRNA A1518/A1519 N6-dimethyltransferase RsmA/KsgA/DIM1 with predicted DNA glycosylase/AP lyase activity